MDPYQWPVGGQPPDGKVRKHPPPQKNNVHIYLYKIIKFRKKIVLRVVAGLVRVTHTHYVHNDLVSVLIYIKNIL